MHQTARDYDAFDRRRAAREYAGNNYDALDTLTGVTGALGNQSVIGYDTLGRTLRHSDPDMGTWVYWYNPSGTIVSAEMKRPSCGS